LLRENWADWFPSVGESHIFYLPSGELLEPIEEVVIDVDEDMARTAATSSAG
jgi:predicted membrane GTPase involved in stress response